MQAVQSASLYSRNLRLVCSQWSSLSASQRLHRLQQLPSPPFQIPAAIRVYIAAETVHAVSRLFSLPNPSQSHPYSTLAGQSEQLVETLLICLKDSTFETSFDKPDKALELSIAHLVHFLLHLFKTENAYSIRLACLTALTALTKACHKHLRAAFLPGVSSKLCAALQNATQLQGKLVEHALTLLSLFIFALHTDTTHHHRNQNLTFSDALQSRRPQLQNTAQPHPKPTSKPTLRVTPTLQWLSSASANLANQLLRILYTSSGPLAHSRPSARAALVHFIHNLFNTHQLNQILNLQTAFTLALFILKADSFEVVHTLADHILLKLCKQPHRRHIFLTSLRAFASQYENSAPEAKQTQSQAASTRFLSFDDTRLSKCIHGMLAAMFPSNPSKSLLPPRRLPAFLSSLGTRAFPTMVCILHQQVLCLPPIPSDQVAVRQSMKNIAAEAAFRVGEAGCIYTVMPQLLHAATKSQSFEDKAHCALMLSGVLCGAISAAEDDTLLSAVEDGFVLLNSFLLLAFDSSSTDFICASDSLVALKLCLLQAHVQLIEECSHLCTRIKRPLPSRLVLVSIVSLLCDAAHGEHLVRPFAKSVLTIEASLVGCSSARDLIHRHLNFVTSRVLNNLTEPWAADVLAFIVEHPDSVSEHATNMVQTSLTRLCDSLAGISDERALQALPAVRTVLSTALVRLEKQHINRRHDDTSSGKVPAFSDVHRAHLRRAVLRYCTEYVENYAELTRAPAEKGEYDDFSQDDGKVRSAFEKLALDTLTASCDLLIGRSWKLRSEVLDCATLAVKLLRKRRRLLLPHAAKLLVLLPDQFILLEETDLTAGDRLLSAFKKKKLRGRPDSEQVEDLVKTLNKKGAELPVVTNACKLIAALADCAGTFIQDRFVRLIYPKLRPLLRLAQYYPTFLVCTTADSSSSLLTPPSHGAMAASDACLEALGSISLAVPIVLTSYAAYLIKYLGVFFDPKNDPVKSPQRKIVHLNRSLVRHETERWVRRVHLADKIVRQLKKVNAGDVLVGLLSYDHTAPNTLEPRSPELHPINVNSIRLR